MDLSTKSWCGSGGGTGREVTAHGGGKQKTEQAKDKQRQKRDKTRLCRSLYAATSLNYAFQHQTLLKTISVSFFWIQTVPHDTPQNKDIFMLPLTNKHAYHVEKLNQSDGVSITGRSETKKGKPNANGFKATAISGC
ncbi:hypothetical protein LSTR_LSTR004973 [Laodelphax striatellus]|uniref:Uncharacterized protein n=1 Tax=Laodelphax striatellus TaxID=195883 RepID=A0A482XNT7_LAOST|nr:hypothetical protein LSTR_LSTR004973 [Laodelphax striatellus]